MALITCPECGKEISDLANSCPNCGCPLNTVLLNSTISTPEQDEIASEHDIDLIQTEPIEKRKRTVLKIVGIITGSVLIFAILCIVLITSFKPQFDYKNANRWLEDGNYQKAEEIFNNIPDYKDVPMLKQEIEYERLTIESINSLKEVLKNPESLQIHRAKIIPSETDPESKMTIIEISAQNGFGGLTRSYTVFNNGKYLGSCDTLDESEIDKDDLGEVIAWAAVDAYFEKPEAVEINIERVKKAIQ